MSKLERITVTMPEEMAALMRSAVDSGKYATASEVVREAMRDWADHQTRREAALQQLRGLIDEGLSSPLLDGPTAMAGLLARVEKAAARGG